MELPDLKALFTEALARPAGAGRSAYLDDTCRDDPALRTRVESLLLAHEQAGSFLASPGAANDIDPDSAMGDPAREDGPDARAGRPVAEGPGSLIGPYKVLQRIGDGGMGIVYMAEQEAPVRRKVALKIIKPGMDTEQVIARFEAERQALAIMDHPHIARVYDAGATASGRPYFVMELVERRVDHRVLRRPPPDPEGAPRALHPRLPGDPARASEGDHPSRHQAVERAGDDLRRPARAQGHRLRRRQGDRPAADRADVVHPASGWSSARSNT